MHEPAAGRIDHWVGISFSACWVAITSAMNTIPLITNRMSKMKCQWRVTPIVCRPPGIPNNGLSVIASSFAVHTRVLGTGPRNRSHSESGCAVQLAVQPGVVGEDLPA